MDRASRDEAAAGGAGRAGGERGEKRESVLRLVTGGGIRSGKEDCAADLHPDMCGEFNLVFKRVQQY